MNGKILVIDDEPEVGMLFRRLLESKNFHVGVATCGDQAKALWNSNNYQAALVDLKLPDIDGLTLLQKIKEVQPDCEVIIMTGYATTKTAVRAIQLGAFDYIEKPFENIEEVEHLIQKALEYRCSDAGAGSKAGWAAAAEKVGLFYGQNEEMHRLLTIADKIARKDINVLIHGETGTGKEVLARFIHAAGSRANENFVAVNCGAMPENLLESHLFGHEKGSFTGASNMHRGIFELANNGTLFLDEIGEATPAIQVKLLRVLETGEFHRVGGEKPIRTNVRLIAATNVDLEKAVEEKKFREDLFYRLDVVRLTLPTLKQRSCDIPGFVHYFLNRLGFGSMQVSPEAMDGLCNYCWPGNLRELYNTVSQAVALCEENIILPCHLPQKIFSAANKCQSSAEKKLPERQNDSRELSPAQDLIAALNNLANDEKVSPQELMAVYQQVCAVKTNLTKRLYQMHLLSASDLSLRKLEADAIENALVLCEGNVSATAKLLGIGRNTLYRKVKEYNL